MTRSVLVVVDVQRDFCAGGALAVPDAEAILPVVNGLVAAFERVIVTQDWHPPGLRNTPPPTPVSPESRPIAPPRAERTIGVKFCVGAGSCS